MDANEILDTLEEFISCPVCLDLPVGPVIQCKVGHHICASCRIQLDACPMCKHRFITTRHLLVEQLTSQLRTFQMLQKAAEIERKNYLESRTSVFTQTDFNETKSQASTQTEERYNHTNERTFKAAPNALPAPMISSDNLPCRIGSCIVTLPYAKLVGHMKECHKDTFYECGKARIVFCWTWAIDTLSNVRDFAFHISNMGLFFFNVTTNRGGDMSAGVKMASGIQASQLFKYRLEFANEKEPLYWSEKVTSCLMPRDSNFVTIPASVFCRVAPGKPIRFTLKVWRIVTNHYNKTKKFPTRQK